MVVAGDDFSCKDTLIGYPVLQPPRMDRRTRLENNSSALDEKRCQSVGNPAVNAIGRSGLLMISRTKFVREDTYIHGVDCAQRSLQSPQDRKRVHHKEARQEPDLFHILPYWTRWTQSNMTTLRMRLSSCFT